MMALLWLGGKYEARGCSRSRYCSGCWLVVSVVEVYIKFVDVLNDATRWSSTPCVGECYTVNKYL